MSNHNYLCYGCKNVFVGTDKLAFICNCLNKGNPKYRGICRQCVVSGELVFIPRDHYLSKVHQYQDKAPTDKCTCCRSLKDVVSIPNNISYEPDEIKTDGFQETKFLEKMNTKMNFENAGEKILFNQWSNSDDYLASFENWKLKKISVDTISHKMNPKTFSNPLTKPLPTNEDLEKYNIDELFEKFQFPACFGGVAVSQITEDAPEATVNKELAQFSQDEDPKFHVYNSTSVGNMILIIKKGENSKIVNQTRKLFDGYRKYHEYKNSVT